MSTLGEKLDNRLADGLVALGVGLRRTAIAAHHLLNLTPASDAGLQRFLTMGGSERGIGADHEAARDACKYADQLAEAEAERDVYEPDELWSAARVRELNDDASEGRAVHPLYRDLQEQHEKWGGYAPDFSPSREFNIMPNWRSRTPQTSAPGSRSETPVEVGSPGVASTPRGAASGHLDSEGLWCRECDFCGGEFPMSAMVDGYCAGCYGGSDPEQPVGVGVANPGADGLEALLVESVLLAHRQRIGWTGGIYCYCTDDELSGPSAWRAHVAPLIVAALKAQK